MRKTITLISIVLLLICTVNEPSALAKSQAEWYAELQDPPGATLDQYSENKVLPKSFLIEMGLRDRSPFVIRVPGIKKRGDENRLGTQVNESVEELILPNVVMTPYYFPVDGEKFDPETRVSELLKAGKISSGGFVARITMSHKQPDKILRFYEKLLKLNVEALFGENTCQSENSIKNHNGNHQRTFPYGLWRIEQAKESKRIFVVEGESSALTLWYHGYPALALGGATKWHDNYIEYMKGISEIYFLLEPDTGGKALLECLRKVSAAMSHSAYQDFASRVRLVVLGPHNDISDMHVSHFKDLGTLKDLQKQLEFKKEFEDYLGGAVSLVHPGYYRDEKLKKARLQKEFNPENRAAALNGRYYTENVKDGILTGKAKGQTGNLFKKEEIIPSTTLKDFSEKKMLPLSELKNFGFTDAIFPHAKLGPLFGILMPTYGLPKGAEDLDQKTLLYTRFRTSMDSAQPSSSRFPNFLFNEDGTLADDQEKTIYGLQYLPSFRKKGSLFLVEGESDTLTMWHYGIPAIGVPGTMDWKQKWLKHLDGFSSIYVNVEGDTGGDHFLEVLTGPAAQKKSVDENLILINFAMAGKDPSDLHVGIMKSASVSVDRLYDDASHQAEKEELEGRFQSAFSEITARGVYWADLKPFFAKYLKLRAKFDSEQNEIHRKMGESLDCANNANNANNKDPKRHVNQKCWTRQEIDLNFMPWPFVDFYETVVGWRESHPRIYLDEDLDPRTEILQK